MQQPAVRQGFDQRAVQQRRWAGCAAAGRATPRDAESPTPGQQRVPDAARACRRMGHAGSRMGNPGRSSSPDRRRRCSRRRRCNADGVRARPQDPGSAGSSGAAYAAGSSLLSPQCRGRNRRCSRSRWCGLSRGLSPRRSLSAPQPQPRNQGQPGPRPAPETHPPAQGRGEHADHPHAG